MGQNGFKRLVKRVRGLAYKHVPMMISCREFEDFVIAYFEGYLPRRQVIVFELHLKICRECRDYLAAYRRTIEVSKRAFEQPDEQIPDEVPEDLIKAILAAREA